MVENPSRPSNLTMLQAGRGLAALLVVLFHGTGLFASREFWGAPILGGFFGFGHAGVQFFFALSGFIMVIVHQRDIGQSGKFRLYVLKRATRIFPVYWIVTAAVFALYAIMDNDRAALIGNSIILVGRDNEAILTVAWTLFHEVLFYGVFGLLFISRRAGMIAFGLWFAGCAYWMTRTAPHYALSSLNLIFGFGMVSALGYRLLPAPRIVMVAAIMLFVILGCEAVYVRDLNEHVRALMFGLSAAIGIAAAIGAESRGTLRAPLWSAALGDSSYSLYLVHYPVLAIGARLWLASPLANLAPLSAFLAVVGVAVTAGMMFHRLIEKPLMLALAESRWGAAIVPRSN